MWPTVGSGLKMRLVVFRVLSALVICEAAYGFHGVGVQEVSRAVQESGQPLSIAAGRGLRGLDKESQVGDVQD